MSGEEAAALLAERSKPRGTVKNQKSRSLHRKSCAAGVSEEEAGELLAKSRELLHARRALRPRPHLDDKVLHYLHHWVPRLVTLCHRHKPLLMV